MTIDKNRDAATDEVSLAYKSLATERTPEALNREILQQAELASRETARSRDELVAVDTTHGVGGNNRLEPRNRAGRHSTDN